MIDINNYDVSLKNGTPHFTKPAKKKTTMGYRISVNYILNSDNTISAIVTILTCDPDLHTWVLQTSAGRYVSKLNLGASDSAEQAEMKAAIVIDKAKTRIEWLRTKAPPKSKVIEI